MYRDDLRFRPRVLVASLAGGSASEAVAAATALRAAGFDVTHLPKATPAAVASQAGACDVLAVGLGEGDRRRACTALRAALDRVDVSVPMVAVGAIPGGEWIHLWESGFKRTFGADELPALVEFVEWLVEPKAICSGIAFDSHP